jgi:plastocyanin
MNLLRQPIQMRWLATVLAVALGATLVLVACGGTASTPPTATATSAPSPTPTTATSPTPTQVVQVKIVEKNEKYSFEPASVTIPKGAEVVWTNSTDAPHTVTSDTNAFGTTSNLTQNQTFMMLFNTAGTYAYHCNIHTYMKATIIVTP